MCFGKVANGAYSKNKAEERAEARKKARQERYAVSVRGKGSKGKKGDQDHGRDHGVPRRLPQDKMDRNRTRLRNMGGKKKKPFALSASGNFRKSDGGYFKKKLRKQTNSEFAA